MLDKILAFIVSHLSESITLKTPMLTSNVVSNSSWVRYVKFGKIVVVTGAIATSTSLSAGAILVEGLPLIFSANATFELNDNNSSSTYLRAYINNDSTGKLRIKTTTSGNHSWRFTVAYISQ